MNSIERSDFSIIGTWRDDMKVDQDAIAGYLETKGRQYLIDNVIARCPTNALSLSDDDQLEVDNRNCVRCMHCLNVLPKALSPGDDKGVSILIGGKRTLKIGDLMGTMIVPFMKLETEEDFERLVELAEETIDFWAENGLEHERCGEMIERIGLVNFLEGIGVEVDPNMVNDPRTSSYVRMDDWDEEAEKWFERKAEQVPGRGLSAEGLADGYWSIARQDAGRIRLPGRLPVHAPADAQELRELGLPRRSPPRRAAPRRAQRRHPSGPCAPARSASWTCSPCASCATSATSSARATSASPSAATSSTWWRTRARSNR